MTTNKPEVFRFHCHGQSAPAYSCNKTADNSGEYVRLSDYEALQAEFDDMERDYLAIIEAQDAEHRKQTVKMQAECEKLRKEAGRTESAFCAVIEYMLGDGRREEPMEFLGYWSEGDFESVKEGWPNAPAEIYYADPLADHEAIDAAMQENTQ